MSYAFSVFFSQQTTAYKMRISDWSSDVCSSDRFGTAFVQDEVHGLLADDLAHGGFSSLAHRFVGVAHVEQVIGRAVGPQAVLHHELHVDDVLVGDRKSVV